MNFSQIRTHLTPPRFLIITNLTAAGIAFIQGLIVARVLGASGYGYVGILVTIGGMMANFWDMRIADLATKLHYRPHPNDKSRSASAMAALILSIVLSVILAASVTVACWFLWDYFTETKPLVIWLMIQGVVTGLSFFIGMLYTLQRLTSRFYIFGTGRVVAQIFSLLIMVACLRNTPTIQGYYDGLLLGTVMTGAIAMLLLYHAWRTSFQQSLFALSLNGFKAALGTYWQERHFLASANIFSYSKMLSRSGDILLFGYFANDAATGVYRLARTLVDNLNVFTDALGQYYTPHFMQRMSEGGHTQMRLSARRFAVLGIGLTALMMPAAAIGLTVINTYFLHGAYTHLASTTALLICNFVWICGVHTWLWPSLLHHNRMHLLAKTSILAALSQLALLALFCIYLGTDPRLAAIASIIYFVLLYVPLLLWWFKESPKQEVLA
ncbi:MAG: oligosaccharide flippase family protein [Pseudomonadota bacterium]